MVEAWLAKGQRVIFGGSSWRKATVQYCRVKTVLNIACLVSRIFKGLSFICPERDWPLDAKVPVPAFFL